MKLVHRVQKLERMEALVRADSPMGRYQQTVNEAAVRLTGKTINQIEHDVAARERVLDDVQESFVRKLSDGDLATLITELERIASEDDITALESRRSRDARS